MKAFEWHSPTTVAQAVKLLRLDTEDPDGKSVNPQNCAPERGCYESSI